MLVLVLVLVRQRGNFGLVVVVVRRLRLLDTVLLVAAEVQWRRSIDAGHWTTASIEGNGCGGRDGRWLQSLSTHPRIPERREGGREGRRRMREGGS
jgi:hypothetical protein